MGMGMGMGMQDDDLDSFLPLELLAAHKNSQKEARCEDGGR